MAAGEGEPIHEGRNVVRGFTLCGQRVAVKRFKPVNIAQQVAYTTWRSTKAERAYRYAALLRERGFSTPHEMAYIKCYSHLMFRVGYFICQRVDDPPAYPVLVDAEAFDRDMASAIGRLLARMHRAGVLHGDLNLGNFLYRRTPDGGYAFQLIDTNRSTFTDGLPSRDVCLYNLRTLTHRRDLLTHILTVYAQDMGWDVQDTIAQVMTILSRFEAKRERKYRWKRLLHIG